MNFEEMNSNNLSLQGIVRATGRVVVPRYRGTKPEAIPHFIISAGGSIDIRNSSFLDFSQERCLRL